jgi:hypothetical protein
MKSLHAVLISITTLALAVGTQKSLIIDTDLYSDVEYERQVKLESVLTTEQ